MGTLYTETRYMMRGCTPWASLLHSPQRTKFGFLRVGHRKSQSSYGSLGVVLLLLASGGWCGALSLLVTGLHYHYRGLLRYLPVLALYSTIMRVRCCFSTGSWPWSCPPPVSGELPRHGRFRYSATWLAVAG